MRRPKFCPEVAPCEWTAYVAAETMWRFVEEPWQYRVLDRLPSGVDEAQLVRMQKLTPTERLDAVVELMVLGEDLRDALVKKRLLGR